MRSPLLLVLAIGLADAAPDRAGPAPPAKLDDGCLDAGCKRHALDHFHSVLANAKAGKLDRTLRISYFGDSLTATDHIVNGVRERFGAIVGRGGPGFVFAASPHPFGQHQAVTRWASGSWQVHGVSTAVPADRLLGLGGSAEGSGSIHLTSNVAVASVDVHFLEQPNGGELEIVAEGKLIERVSTAGDVKRAGFRKIAVPVTTKKVELRSSRRVRLFGAALEAPAGAVVDNLGVVNATVKGLAKYNHPDHLKHQLAHRAPDLVIVMFGTNEAEWLIPKSANMTEHEQVFNELLASVRAANPDSSCLVISPLDQLDWRKDNAPPRTSIPAMVDAQHRAAKAHGCAFWDAYEWMGGKGASAAWFRRGLLIKDFQHPTMQGNTIIANALFSGLVR